MRIELGILDQNRLSWNLQDKSVLFLFDDYYFLT